MKFYASKITQKCVHGIGWNVLHVRQMSRHGRTDQLLDPDHSPDRGFFSVHLYTKTAVLNGFVQFWKEVGAVIKWLKPSYIHLNTPKILRLWFNYFNWQLYMQLHTWIRNLDEYAEKTRGNERSYFKGVFCWGDDKWQKQPGYWFGGWVWQRQRGWSLMTA